MTGMPAQRFGLTQRGLVRVGYYADLVLFDPEKIIDTATFDEPIQVATGIERVWVNGLLSYTSRGSTQYRRGRFAAQQSIVLTARSSDEHQAIWRRQRYRHRRTAPYLLPAL
jgi:N-acyl-D-aspartate/D-glutamate deacylase